MTDDVTDDVIDNGYEYWDSAEHQDYYEWIVAHDGDGAAGTAGDDLAAIRYRSWGLVPPSKQPHVFRCRAKSVVVIPSRLSASPHEAPRSRVIHRLCSKCFGDWAEPSLRLCLMCEFEASRAAIKAAPKRKGNA